MTLTDNSVRYETIYRNVLKDMQRELRKSVVNAFKYESRNIDLQPNALHFVQNSNLRYFVGNDLLE